jgi:DNA-binding MarR family transcriptional regulator
MGYRKSRLGLMIQLDPKAASRTLIATFRRHHGSTTKAAKAHGVSMSTMKRWVASLEKAGYHVREAIEEFRARVIP